MKKIFKMMMAVVAGFAALTACTNEPEEGVTPDNTQEYCIVKVGMSKATKGSLTDAEGIKWAVGDQIKYAGGVELTSEALTTEDIEDDGYTANFKFPAALNEVNRTGWFSSTKNHPGNHNEVEFTLGTEGCNVYSQAVAGEMNSRYLFLHSGTGLVNITQGEAPVVNMDIAGAIFRIMPYTETYNDEKIQYVELTGKNTNGIVGTVAYDRGAGTYKGANDINWRNYNFVRINLDEPFALTNANSRENSKGVYMAIARTTETHPIEGYTITVKTDKATYTFSSDDNLVVGENELRNVYLKLENGSRVDNSAPKGTLKYEGELKDENNVSHTGCTDLDISWWYAMTKDTNAADYVKREGAEYTAYYENVVFTYADKETGEPVDWLSVRYNDGGNSVWLLTVKPQEVGAAARSATITATYSNVNGYVIEDAYKTKTITINQMEYINGNVVTFDMPGMYDFTISSDAIDNAEVATLLAYNWWCIPMVNGVSTTDKLSDPEVQKLCRNTTFTCHIGSDIGPVADWISFGYPTDEGGNVTDFHPYISVDRNTGDKRSVLVVIRFTTPDGYIYNGEAVEDKFIRQFLITQEAYSAEIVATLNDVYVGTVGYEGEEITVGNLAMTADGEAVADANEFCNVAINGGASVALAADGTITATIPANASNTAKEYTVTIKDKSGNNLVEDVTINQEANPEGGEVVEPEHTFSYTIINNMADGSNDTGLDAGAVSVQYYRFENITIDGTKLNPGTDMTNLVNDTELVNALIDHAFDFGTVTQEDIFDNTNVPLDADPTTFVTLRAWTDGGAAIYVYIDLTANNTGARRTFKIITKDGEGNQVSSIVYFQNQ